MSLYTAIINLSRITSHSATIIDNILTNNMENKIVRGLLAKHISDHLPVFAIYDCHHKLMKESKIRQRRRTTESVNAFTADLMFPDWSNVLQTQAVNTAYEIFLDSFLGQYNKSCPVRQSKRKNKRSEKPWLTRGILITHEKKNSMYTEFIKYRCKDTEIKYKKIQKQINRY